MSAFSFRLEKVLELRRHVERETAAKLARARTEVETARQAMAALESARSAGRDHLARAHGAGSSIGQLQNLQYVLDRIGHLIDEAMTAANSAEQNVNAVLADMAVALRERRILDRLRERDLESWRIEQQRAEQRSMDEAALVRHAKARRSADHAKDELP